MFANLKNKLIEEVKASPSKFQQFANAAQAAVTSSSNTPSGSESVSGNENFFSITEEDTPQNSPHKPLKLPMGGGRAKGPNISPQSSNGAPSRTRKLSNSSVASDVSFRLPAYESPAVYHLQSDFEASASEMEDSASTVRLDVINKEQLYDAYRKALDSYQKYRSRYTDLARKYKDLERDSTKARSVLVETQDKAIRRINELREQCALEQQAKAHLEEALRVEMDDMQCKMQTYKTKLTLLGENPENIIALTKNEPLISINSSNSTKPPPTDASNLINLDAESNHVPVNNNQTNLESQLADKQTEINELTRKLQDATNTIDLLKKQEEENAISLAQTKQAIYSELESKENQVSRLKTNLADVESKYQQAIKENAELSSQAADLPKLKETLKTLTSAKQEAEAKVISLNHIQTETKQQLVVKDKTIQSLEDRLQNTSNENDERLKTLRQENADLGEAIRQYQSSEISLAEISNELNRFKTENIALQQTIEGNLNKIKKLESEITNKQEQLTAFRAEKENESKILEELQKKIEELSRELEESHRAKQENETRLKQLESEIHLLNEQSEKTESETITSLRAALHQANEEFNEQLKQAKDTVAAKEKELKASNTKLNKLKKQLDAQEANATEIERLRNTISEYETSLSTLQTDHQLQQADAEKEKTELKAQVNSILSEIGAMEEAISVVRSSHSELEVEKRLLEQKIEHLMAQSQIANDDTQNWKNQVTESQEKLKLVEQKLQVVESENSQLAEKNCLTEENSNRLEKLFAELERQRNESETEIALLKNQYEASESNIQKLNEKLSQVLDENSRLHNAKELMEHEYRSLQDQCESKEKEKLCVLDSNKCLEDEMKSFKEEIDSLTRENNNLSEMANTLRGDLNDALEKARMEAETNGKLTSELNGLTQAKQQLEEELRVASSQVKALQSDTSLSGALAESQQLVVELKKRLSDTESSSQQQIQHIEGQLQELRQKLENSQKDYEQLAASNEELSTLREKIRELQQQVDESTNQAHELQALKEQLSANDSTISALKFELATAQETVLQLTDANQQLRAEIAASETRNQSRISELESQLRQITDENDNLQKSAQNATDLEKTLQNHEKIRVENEYLINLNEQLQADIRQMNEDRANVALEIVQLKKKINSQQCELYVLNENQAKHTAEVEEKHRGLVKAQEDIGQLRDTLEKERAELIRQTEHTNFITEQNDHIQKELLACQQQVSELEKELRETKSACEAVTKDKLQLIDQLASAEASSKQQADNLRAELDRNGSTLETLNKEVDDLNKEIRNVDALKEEKNELLKQIEMLKVELAEKVAPPVRIESATESARATQQESENLRKINERLQKELEDLQYKSRSEIANLTEEIDDLHANAKHLSERLKQYERNSDASPQPSANPERILQEKEELESKLKTIMHDVQDVSNRNIFLEQKCENYLILEQSNERLKSQNEKLSRQLDETLISMQHNEGLTANTEFEYLKNIMFQYLTGTVNGNNETLVKVISAVLKFTPQQTQVALEKEHQRRSLLGQLNKLL